MRGNIEQKKTVTKKHLILLLLNGFNAEREIKDYESRN